MLTIPGAMLRTDFPHLGKDNLKSICTELELPSDGSALDISTRIWEKIEHNSILRENALDEHSNRLYAGKVALTWYDIESGASLVGSKNLIKKFLQYDPFEKMYIPSNELIKIDPTVVGGVALNDTEYYLRFMYKAGTFPVYQGNQLVQVPSTAAVTMYVNESTNCIEVRTNSKKAKNIIEKFAKMIGQTKTITPKKIMAKYGFDIEAIASQINATLMDATSKPELSLSDLNHNQAESVFQMLKALDSFFEDDDMDNLSKELNNARAILGANAENVPFTALVLAGLEKVGLGVDHNDLRENQLYKYLNEYMQHQGGFMKFDWLGDSYTIRVGIGTNSISFLSPATEEAIAYIRNKIISN